MARLLGRGPKACRLKQSRSQPLAPLFINFGRPVRRPTGAVGQPRGRSEAQ